MKGRNMNTYRLLGAFALGIVGAFSNANAAVESCGSGSTKSGQKLGVNGSDNYLHAGPSSKTPKLLNEKTTKIMGKPYYLQIDNSVTVIEDCTKAGWSKVRVHEPDWLRKSHIGWVPSSVLHGRKVDSGGKTVFTEADFLWDKKTSPYKKVIIDGVNKVYRENSRCKHIDPSSAYISSSKGTKDNPVFFVTCGKGAGAFNAYFSKSDVEGGSQLKAKKNIDRASAVQACEDYAKNNATHPSTVSFSRVMDLAVVDHPSGRTTVTSTFTAKNSFNTKLKFNIRCLFDGSQLLEGNISEAR